MKLNSLQISLLGIWAFALFSLIYFTCGQYNVSLLPDHVYWLGSYSIRVYYYSVSNIEYWSITGISTLILGIMTKIGWKLQW